MAEEWLAPYEKLPEAENITRLAGDREMVDRLRLNGFDGAHYTYFASELAKYGLAVMTGWMRKGVIFERVASKGFGRPMPAPLGAFDDDGAEELAGEVVSEALKFFRTAVLIPGKWDPARGASIKTYFIGQCLLRFSNIYKRWLGELTREKSTAVDDEILMMIQFPATTDVSRTAEYNVEAPRLLKKITDPRAREAFVLHAAGHSYPEIGLRLGETPKAVERMIANARARLRKGNVA